MSETLMDISSIITAAKLGSARKDAQIDTCTVFAAALYDVLSERGVACKMITAVSRWPNFAHAVVEADGRYYDSMGEFSVEIYRARAKIHPKAAFDIQYQLDSRLDGYDPEFDEMYAFYVKALNKAIRHAQTVDAGTIGCIIEPIIRINAQ